MWESDDRFRAVRAAELELLDGAVRGDPDRVGKLLHPDFVEVGRSGRRWRRDETIAALAEERQRPKTDTDEWLFTEVSPTLVLVTYRITAASGSSRHSSLWEISAATPVMRFHQGTALPAGPDERSAPDRPEIVCICGSIRFADEMRAATRELTLAGAIVVAPAEAEGVLTDEQKAALGALHLRKIDLADRILVVNPGGYVGESARREIAYARAAGKPVSFTDSV